MVDMVLTNTKQISHMVAEITSCARKSILTTEVFYVSYGNEKPEKSYTYKQRGALHVWFRLLATAMNDAGLLRKVIRVNGDLVEEEWTEDSVKIDIYKVVLRGLTGKNSTEEQDTVEPSVVVNHINRHFGEKHGFTVGFPTLR